MMARVVRGLAWATLASVALEVAARQLARVRLVPWVPESAGTLAVLALVAGVVGIAVRRKGLRALAFGTALACGLALQLQVGARLQSDAFYYYAYLRSLTFDRDVSLANDYRMLGLGDKPHLFEPTVTGYAHSAWTMGPAIVWSPFFATGHIVATRLAAQGRDVAVDGTSFPYRQSIVIAGLVYALIGWWLALRLCEHWFGTRLAATATVLVAGGSFMLWYMIVEPTMTHAPSMAAVAGFFLYWARTRDHRSVRGWIVLGLIAGLMTLLRWQNALFAIVPACDAAVALWHAWRANDRSRVRATLLGGLVFTAVAAIAFLPQMLAWHAIYGSLLAVSPVGPQIRLADPELVLTLFSSRNGLLAMSPILYIGALGLLAFSRRRPSIGVPMVLATVAMVWFNASIQDWWGSDGYGGRRFDGIIPLMVIGVACALDSLRGWVSARPQWIVAGAAAVLVAWNLTLMATAQDGTVRLGEAIPFGQVSGAQARVWHAWIGHPFSFPANLWFALRNGVSPSAYDRLGPAMFLGDPLQPTGRIDIGGDDALLLQEGWFAPELDGGTSYRWAKQEARLLIPLAHTAPLEVQIRARAFTYPGAGPQQLRVHTPTGVFGPFVVTGDWQVVTFETPVGAWRVGLNRVRLVFDSATTPASVGLGGDTRALAAAIDVFRVTQR
jgi:hypothetical protein